MGGVMCVDGEEVPVMVWCTYVMGGKLEGRLVVSKDLVLVWFGGCG
jgi:hypothetical protein